LLIISSSKWKVERLLPLATKAAWILTALLCFVFIFFTMLSIRFERLENSLPRKDKAILPRAFSPSFEKIGEGPLSLHSRKKKTILPDMSQELALLAKNIRPGRESKEASFLLFLRSSRLEKQVKNGEIIFLSCDASSGATLPVYRFTDRKTPLWIRPTFLERNKILVEVGLFMPAKDSEAFLEEKAQFVLQEEPFDWSNKFQNIIWLESLKEAKLWGPDLFLGKYGGENYQSLKTKSKLEIPGNGLSTFCFVGVGDFLVWDEGKWSPVERSQIPIDKPLAHIKVVSPRMIELEVWDEEGFYPQVVKIDIQNGHRISGVKPDMLPQAVRLRTTNQVSCSLGKRRCLLRKGDWVLKTSRGWRTLKTPVDKEEYLLHKVRGELCVFDSLVREQGKLVMKGHWIDEMRTQIYPFSQSVSGDQQGKAIARKEKKSQALRQAKKTSITYLPSTIKKETPGEILE
jgi:hypothetical protein